MDGPSSRATLTIDEFSAIALEKDAPTPRRVQPPTEGRVIAFQEVGGLHHRYERRAA
jgi:hypothetical protein